MWLGGGWLVGWLLACLLGWLVVRLVDKSGCLDGWLAWLLGCLAGWLGWLLGWLERFGLGVRLVTAFGQESKKPGNQKTKKSRKKQETKKPNKSNTKK